MKTCEKLDLLTKCIVYCHLEMYCMQVIDARDRYLDDVTSNYTLLAPNNVAIHKMLNFTSSDFWKDDSNVFAFFRCVTCLLSSTSEWHIKNSNNILDPNRIYIFHWY